MSSLQMRRADLTNLPPMPPLPVGAQIIEWSGEDPWNIERLRLLLAAAFPDWGWNPEKVHDTFIADTSCKKTYIIEQNGEWIATATVRVLPDMPQTGYLHWVAALPARKGEKLGYIASLATLEEFARMGLDDAILHTDDHRLPALMTYFRLGFVPEPTDETHTERWRKVYAALKMQ